MVEAEGAAAGPVVLEHFSSSRYSTSGDDPIGVGAGAGQIWRRFPEVAAGKATRIRLPWPQGERRSFTLLRASGAGLGAAYGMAPDKDEPIRLNLTAQPAVTVTVTGGQIDGVLTIDGHNPTAGYVPVRCESGSSDGGRFTFAALPLRGFVPKMRLVPQDPQAPPCRVVMKGVLDFREPASIGLQKLRRSEIRVREEHGVPVPGAIVAVAEDGEGAQVHWQDRFAVDMAGRATLLLDDGDWVIYALTGTAHGHVLVRAEQK